MSTTFKLEIEMGNDAMLTKTHLRRKLAEVVEELRWSIDVNSDNSLVPTSHRIKDANGNTCGQWTIITD